MESLLVGAMVSGLNHVLRHESWARERLHAFAGQAVQLRSGPLAMTLMVDAEGLFRHCEASLAQTAEVTIELPSDTLARLANGRDAVFSAARISGSADFAEALALVFRNLRWDVEEDLSRLVGDIFARRLVQFGGRCFAWQKRAGSSLLANLREYAVDEVAILLPRPDAQRFASEVVRLQADVDNLEKRLAGL